MQTASNRALEVLERGGTPYEVEVVRHLTGTATQLAEEIEAVIVPSRARSLAITKLDEVVLWAIAAVLNDGCIDQ